MSARPELSAVPHHDSATAITKLPPSAYRGLELTDAMPRELRALVHEFGFPIVHAFIEAGGIRDPRKIRHLVKTCWDGPRSYGDGAQSRKARGGRSPVLDKLDWLLIQSGSAISAETLLRVLRETGLVIVPLVPTDYMVDASIEATGQMGLVSKREKHHGRLAAAIRAAASRHWPHLFAEAKR